MYITEIYFNYFSKKKKLALDMNYMYNFLTINIYFMKKKKEKLII